MSNKKKYKKYGNASVKRSEENLKVKTTSRPQYDIFAIAAMFYAMWTLIVTPLWLEHQYFNQIQAKGHAFYVGAVIMVILIVVATIKKKSVKPLIPSKSIAEISIVAFGVLAVISSVLSKYPLVSLLGIGGWWVGGLTMLLFSIIAIYLSNTINYSKVLTATIMGIGFLVFLLIMLHSAGVDVLYLHANMKEAEKWSYMSTIGNIDWHIAFICLTVPIIAFLFMKSDDRDMTITYGIYMFFASMGIVLTRADGLYVGFGLCAFFAIPFVMKSAQRLRRFLLIVGFYGTSVLIVQYAPFYENVRIGGGTVGFLGRPIIAVAMLIAGYGGFALMRFVIKELSSSFSKISTLALELLLLAFVVYFAIDTVKNFNNDWGSGRGMIWIETVRMFKEMPFANKLIGLGPETLCVYNQTLNEKFGVTVLTNHSDFFQFLVTNGILGLGAWIAMWIGVIIKQIKSREMEDEAFMFFVCLMAYLGQSTVFTTECLSWPMLIVVMGLFLRYDKKRKITKEPTEA